MHFLEGILKSENQMIKEKVLSNDMTLQIYVSHLRKPSYKYISKEFCYETRYFKKGHITKHILNEFVKKTSVTSNQSKNITTVFKKKNNLILLRLLMY